MEIYLTADTHFDHKRIIEFEPTRKILGKDHIQMTEGLIHKWNSVVKPNDLVIHLGDVFLCGSKRAEEIAARLNGRKILVAGNHDCFSKTKYEKLGFEYHNYYLIDGLFLSHHPQDASAIQTAINNEAIVGNVHGHVHSDIGGLDQTIYKCVSTELTYFEPIHIDVVKEHFIKNRATNQMNKLRKKVIENDSAKSLCLEIVLPYSHGFAAETIVVPYQFIPQKMKYVEETYDDNLVMKRNTEIKILNFYLS